MKWTTAWPESLAIIVFMGGCCFTLQQREATIADFEAALREQDADRLRDLAHKLQGVAGKLGAQQVQQCAEGLESWAAKRGGGSAAELYASLRASLQALCQRILEQLQGWSEPAFPSRPLLPW